MNKKLLALAIGAAAALPVIAQADGPTIYGKMNVTLDSIETDTGVAATSTDAWYLNSNASRLGIKGDAATDVDGMKAVYQAEYEIDVDDGAVPFKQRNIYAGLKHEDLGTLKFGKMDTPLKESQGKVDQFNDTNADIKGVMPGEVRADNVIEYTSPKIAGMLTVKLAFMPAENVDVNNADGDQTLTTKPEDGLFDTTSLSLVYEQDAFYAALAMDSNVRTGDSVDGFIDIDGAGAGTVATADITRLVAAYKTDAIEVGAIYQTAEDVSKLAGGASSGREDTAMVLSGAYKTGNLKIKAQYGTGEGDKTSKEKTLMAIGADYAVGKATTLFTYYSAIDTDNLAPAVDTSVTTLALGIEQKF